MSRKTYKTAQGKSLDLGALQLQNESVKAVGNMGVNARGDKVGPNNSTVEGRTQSVTKQYKKQINRTNVSDDVVVVSKRSAQKQTQSQPASKAVETVEFIDEVPVTAEKPQVKTEPVKSSDTAPQAVEPEVTETKTSNKPIGGLADAIAKAKSVKQEALKTPRQQAQEKKGVKRI